ncbi:MAG: hypothetical protein UX28_C0003G0125 [Candidatus Pacebacteria bacterium GW2011_GWA1_46_10]|nr:MAG: hypothetical protein UX28_C0003G0125 [Candidatus Pacebacteria bacterium GW2011_GWA1_46_10]HCR81573.1 hypothetical protein [Candidatus Paceibacterota bacterium]
MLKKQKKIKKNLNPLAIIISIIFFLLSFFYKDTFFLLIGVVLIISIFVDRYLYDLSYKKIARPKIKFPDLKNLSIKKGVKNIDFRLLLNNKIFLIYVGLFTVFFTFVSLRILEASSENNIFIAYFKSTFFTFFNRLDILLVLILLSGALVFILYRKQQNIRKAISFTGLTLLTAWVLSPLITLIFGLVQVNWAPIKVNNSSEVKWGADEVVNYLKDSNNLPTIRNGEENFSKTIVDAYEGINSSENLFFNNNVLNLIPENFVFTTVKNNSDLVIVKNSLVFRKINEDEIEKISPVLGKLYVKNYLEDRYVKSEPKIEVLGRQEYLSYRETMFNEQIKEVRDLQTEITNEVNRIYGVISQAKQNITLGEQYVQDSRNKQQADYDYCKSAGYYTYYYEPGFHRYYSDQECENVRGQWDSIVIGYQNEISEWQAILGQAQAEASEWNQINEDLEYYVTLIETQKGQTVYELGIFQPEDQIIKIALDYTSSNTLADYLSTLVHEYFHYTSYVSEETVLPGFFEEGLTEYFARKAIKQELNISTQLGYPVLVKIIEKIVDDIGEDELKEIYLTKNTDRLIGILNEKYGDTFYNESELYFTLLPFLPAEDQLTVANNILIRIGGNQLNSDDIFSKESNL